VLDVGTYTVEKAEDIGPGSVITTVTASDADKGETVTYSWDSTPADFTLDEVSGRILVAGNLDREQTAFYSLKVKATDGQNVATTTVNITLTDVNDNAPIFTTNTYRSVTYVLL